MLFVIPALIASLAYSSDVIFAKLALESIPMYIFIFILAMCYLVLAIGMYIYKPQVISNFFVDSKNAKYVFLAIAAVVIGTMIGDIFMWYSIQLSSRQQLPIAIALVHTAPVISLLLVALFYKEYLKWQAVLGIFITFIGCAITIMYSGGKVPH